MAAIVLENLTKIYAGNVAAVDRLNLSVNAGELLVVVGPSGCGKTTLLRMIAGLESPTRGTVNIAGRDVTALAPRHRGVAMVMQRSALYPHLRTRQNIGFSLRMRGVGGTERDRRVTEVARLLGIEDLLDRRPHELSGGQQRRVALARSLVTDATCLLLDEPLSHLDATARRELRTEIVAMHNKLNRTTVYVTHDQEEAMAIGNRLAVMAGGVIHQCDDPQFVYEHPASHLVADFIGTTATPETTPVKTSR